jgi:hypothetical protein
LLNFSVVTGVAVAPQMKQVVAVVKSHALASKLSLSKMFPFLCDLEKFLARLVKMDVERVHFVECSLLKKIQFLE